MLAARARAEGGLRFVSSCEVAREACKDEQGHMILQELQRQDRIPRGWEAVRVNDFLGYPKKKYYCEEENNLSRCLGRGLSIWISMPVEFDVNVETHPPALVVDCLL